MDYLTIEEEYSCEIIVQKSRFICFIFPCDSITYFSERIKKAKKNFYDATHIVPAYRIKIENNQIKEHFSDDREPAKTAGWPLLYILQQKYLIQIGVIVIRYFGGIKLGTSGLQKAYSQVLLDAISKARTIEYQTSIICKIYIPIDKEHIWYDYIKSNNLNDKIRVLKNEYIFENNQQSAFFEIQTSEKIALNLSNIFKLEKK